MSDKLKATWAACLKDIRMVVDSTPSDEELEEKIGQVAQELWAIEKALNDDGNYLGIVNKVGQSTSYTEYTPGKTKFTTRT